MSDLTPERWAAIGPYLDRALELPADERARWLAALRDPALEADLLALLDEHAALDREGFLERSPAPVGPAPALAGATFGAYTLEAPIGQGGMGTVWLARRSDGRFEGRVAVKLLNLALVGRAGQERFRREGNVLARLSHPHIAHLLDAGVSPCGQPYLVLEHVDGQPIDQYCNDRGLDAEGRLRLVLDTLAAVAHAHAHLVVHRDIKPSNVFVTTDGHVKLLDFGIAKLLDADEGVGDSTFLTRDGGRAFTPECAAPEQISGGTVTTATDVYALGVLIYLLLAGRHPTGDGQRGPADLVRGIVDTEPLRVSDAARHAAEPGRARGVLRGDLDTIVAKALKKNPEERYPSVSALAEDLRRYLRHEPIRARPDTFRYRAGKFLRRNRAVAALAMAATLATAGGVAGTLIQARTARSQRDFAQRQRVRAEALNDLNAFVLSDAAPLGKTFTVNDLLARAEHIVERQHGDPAGRVELLVSIGMQYQRQDEDARARDVLAHAYSLSRTTAERSSRAKAACALASALSRGHGLSRAEALLQEGLRELPEEPDYALDRAFCLLRGGEVAREAGAAREAVLRDLAARRALQQSPDGTEALDLSALMELAESYRVAGQQREAAATFEQAARRLAVVGRDDTQQAGTLFNNWALTLHQLGRPFEAERIYRRAIEIGRTENGDTLSPMLLNNYARTLEELHRVDEAAAYVERAYAKAVQAGDEVVISQSLVVLATVYRDRGDLPRAEGMLAELEPRLRRTLPAGHIAFASLSLQRALVAQARGDLQGALALSTGAVELAQASVKAGMQGAQYLPVVLSRRSDVERELHAPDKAADDAIRAVNLLKPTLQPGTCSCTLGRAYLALGRALRDEGRHAEARAALASAVEQLRTALGPDHPDTRIAGQVEALEARGR